MLSTNFDEGKKKQIKDDKERFSTLFRTLVTLINWHLALYAAFLVTMFARNPCSKNIRNGNRSGSSRVFLKLKPDPRAWTCNPDSAQLLNGFFFARPKPALPSPVQPFLPHIQKANPLQSLKKKKKYKSQTETISIFNMILFHFR